MPDSPYDTPERSALRSLVTDFTQREIVPSLAAWEQEGHLPRDLHLRAAGAGILGIGFREDVGGSGGNLVDVVIFTEALLEAGASGGVIAGLFSHGIALPHGRRGEVAVPAPMVAERDVQIDAEPGAGPALHGVGQPRAWGG
ncbi:MAG: acyl-CoA dehydrogenase family protein, partial [Candidatus Nanopelagicales bacterium]